MRASFSYWTRWAGRALRTLKLSAVKPLRNPVHHCPCVNVIRGRQSNVVIVTYLWRWHSLLQFGQAVILAKDIKAGAGLALGACGPSWTLNALRPRGAGWPGLTSWSSRACVSRLAGGPNGSGFALWPSWSSGACIPLRPRRASRARRPRLSGFSLRPCRARLALRPGGAGGASCPCRTCWAWHRAWLPGRPLRASLSCRTGRARRSRRACWSRTAMCAYIGVYI